MLIHGTNCFGMPLMFDTTKIDATCCDQVEFWQVVLFLNSGKLFCTAKCMNLETTDPPVDLEKLKEKVKK